MDVSQLQGLNDGLKIDLPTVDFQVVFNTISIQDAGVLTKVGASVQTVGSSIAPLAGFDEKYLVGGNGVPGVCAIIVEGKLYARIALHNSSFSVDDCFALPLPLFAYREGEQVQPIGIADGRAGWNIYPGLSRVRVAGYNLPTSLKYIVDDESNPQDLTADGGDYGIEFTQPGDATFIIVFDASFWLYFYQR